MLLLGGVGFVFSLLFKLGEVISAILAMRILVQFVGQAVGLVLLRRRRGTQGLPFRMPLYPLPVLVAVAVWLWVFLSIQDGIRLTLSQTVTLFLPFQVGALLMMAVGVGVFLLWSRQLRRWPFEK
ncbi:hypothetical protein MUN84_10295 [Hymenobacter sp. 5516J-16]|uniref:hypothetical protein n=1 Tax=Hymenobacter sp. 5516J-16 TaxID=2932253 RepID=UPI001FD3368D|nr:hypothetical protein [Hymenobacter sp. 5516J-16]UOQ78877.1 hypothetical protein MUN84_10295 [Hymenobacter sp. 5516J-16]